MTTAAHASPYGTLPPAAPLAQRKPISLPRLMEMHARGEKIAMLTAYDATFAAIADSAGVDCILVGDSLGMVCQGRHSTVGVSLEEMRYHTECVSRGVRRVQGTTWIVADLPFGSYQQSKEQALASAVVLMEAGAHMIKLEGGCWTAPTVQFLTERGIPVCAHLGLTPQTVHALGGYRVQGRNDQSAQMLRKEAHELAQAGARLLVLEMVPAPLAASLTKELSSCATIGIGAGVATAGQVLVLHDMLGMNIGKMPKFVRNFMQDQTSVSGAMQAFVQAVKQGEFPVDAEHAWD